MTHLLTRVQRIRIPPALPCHSVSGSVIVLSTSPLRGFTRHWSEPQGVVRRVVSLPHRDEPTDEPRVAGLLTAAIMVATWRRARPPRVLRARLHSSEPQTSGVAGRRASRVILR